MPEFIGEKIEVEKKRLLLDPLRFTWRGQTHEVIEILDEHVDIGHGALPVRAINGITRHHRRYFVVKDSAGDVFEIYLDYRKSKESDLVAGREEKVKMATIYSASPRILKKSALMKLPEIFQCRI